MKHVGMSQSAMTATRNEVAQRLNRLKVEPPKVTTFAALPIGTAVAQSSRTVADGCERLRTQKQRRANTSQPPDPQSKMRTLHYAFGNKTGHHNTRDVEMIDGKSFKQTNKIKLKSNKLTNWRTCACNRVSLSLPTSPFSCFIYACIYIPKQSACMIDVFLFVPHQCSSINHVLCTAYLYLSVCLPI